MLRQETTELGEKSAHPGVTESTNTDATRTLEKEMLAPEDASGRSWRQRVGKVEPYQLVFIYPLSLQLQTSLEKASVVILESAGMRGILGGLASAGYSPKVEASASWAESTVPCGPAPWRPAPSLHLPAPGRQRLGGEFTWGLHSSHRKPFPCDRERNSTFCQKSPFQSGFTAKPCVCACWSTRWHLTDR